jgi:hypothetical protein
MRSSPESASACGVILRPGPSFQIRNTGRDAGGFDAVVTRCKVIFSKMHFSLNNSKLIVEMAQSVILSMVALDFGSGVPVVKVGNDASESVVGGGRAVE